MLLSIFKTSKNDMMKQQTWANADVNVTCANIGVDNGMGNSDAGRIGVSMRSLSEHAISGIV